MIHRLHLVAARLAPTPAAAASWTMAGIVLLTFASCAAAGSLAAGEAVPAATAAQWAADAGAASAAAGRQAADATGWTWGQVAAGAGAMLLFCSRLVPGWGGLVADLAWRWFADRRARDADAAQAAAGAAFRIVHQVAPNAVQTALDRLPPDTAAKAAALLPKA